MKGVIASEMAVRDASLLLMCAFKGDRFEVAHGDRRALNRVSLVYPTGYLALWDFVRDTRFCSRRRRWVAETWMSSREEW